MRFFSSSYYKPIMGQLSPLDFKTFLLRYFFVLHAYFIVNYFMIRTAHAWEHLQHLCTTKNLPKRLTEGDRIADFVDILIYKWKIKPYESTSFFMCENDLCEEYKNFLGTFILKYLILQFLLCLELYLFESLIFPYFCYEIFQINYILKNFNIFIINKI